jgi:hypothetical protein
MFISRIKLYKYRRFPLADRELLDVSFTAKMTVITGGNGSGKSSLVSELSPLPSDKEHFHKGGYKEVYISHMGSEYVLRSDFTSGASYSFIKDDTELNPSGLVSIQKELSAIHFNITPVIHDILSGQESFTEMSLIARKKLFSEITHLNIDAILNNYNSLKEELKSNELMLKSLSQRLLTEQDKIDDVNRESVLIEQLKAFNEEIGVLLDTRERLTRYAEGDTLDVSHTRLSHAVSQLKSHMQTTMVVRTAYPASAIDEMSTTEKEGVSVCKYKLDELYSKLEHLQTLKRTLEGVGSHDIDEMNRQLHGYIAEYDTLCSKLEYFTATQDMTVVTQGLSALEATLSDIVSEMSDNPDRKISKSSYIELMERKTQALDKLNETIREVAVFESKLLNLAHIKDTTCPSCNYTWLDASTVDQTTHVKQHIQQLYLTQAQLQDTVKQLDQEIATQADYLGKMTQLTSLYSHTKDKIPAYWHEVTQKGMIYQKPTSLLTLLRNMQIETQLVSTLQSMNDQITKLKSAVQVSQDTRGQSSSSMQQDIDTCEKEIRHTQKTLQRHQNTLQAIERARGIHKYTAKLNSSVEALKDDVRQSNLSHCVQAVLTECDARLSVLKVSVIETQKQLSTQTATQAAIQMLQMSVDDTQENIKVLNLILTELSPKNGYIAKTISSFLNTIIQSINSVIATIWDYGMTLRAIDVEEDALNYRFKVDVMDKHSIGDVSKISSGMKEITNLGLKVTLFKLLKLEGYPISLDEFGVKMDNTHRNRIASLIFQMLNSSMYSQIFLVTHLDTSYSEFDNTQLIEL